MAASERPSFRLLGHLEVGGGSGTLRGLKQRMLLAYLLLQAGEVVSTERLVEAVWGESPPATATAIVHSYVRRVRTLLAGTSAELVTHAPGYLLRLADDELDVRLFERLAHDAKASLQRGDPRQAQSLLRRALELWRGGALADLPPEGFVPGARARLDQQRLEARLDLMDADLALGAAGELVPELDAIVREEPFQERPRRQLMIALYRAGRQADALELYRDTRRLLAEELGLEPTRELQRLQQSILQQDESLDAGVDEPPIPRPLRSRSPRWVLPPAALAVLAVATAIIVSLADSSGPSAPPPTRPARILASFDIPQPSCCGFGFNGVWVTGHHDETLREIDPRTNRQKGRWSVAGYQSGVPLAQAGSVWIPSAAGDLVRFDPARHVATARIQAQGPTVAFGFLTIWETTTRHQLDRIDLQTNRVRQSIPLAAGSNDWVDELAVGDSAVWVAVADKATLLRIDPTTNRIVARIAGFGDTDSGMPVAVDQNAVWALRFVGGLETLFRVDSTTDRIVARIPVAAPGGVAPSGTIASGDGYIWTGNWDNTITKVDPATNRIVAVYKLPGSPQNLHYGEGSLWVDSYDESRVWRIDPNS